MADQVLAKGSRESSAVIECLHSVLREISDGAAEPGICGLLLGTRDDARVRILAFRRLVPKRQLGRSGMLSDSDQDAVARLISGPPGEGELYGLEPVGWFRAQPRRDLVLSEWELELLNTFFTQPRQVAMVLRPAITGPTRARFYIREAGEFLANEYRELIIASVARNPMITVEPGQTPREFPHLASPAQRPENLRFPTGRPPFPANRLPFGADRPPFPADKFPPIEPLPEPAEERTRQPGGWIWRTVSSLAITAFVIGYWWISASHKNELVSQRPRTGNIVQDADPRLAPSAPPDALAEEINGSRDRLGADQDLPRTPPDRSFAGDAEGSVPLPDLRTDSGEERVQEKHSRESNEDATRLKDDRTRRGSSEKQSDSKPPAKDAVPESRPLRPLRLTASTRRDSSTPELAPPPVVVHDAGPALPPAFPQTMTMVAPVKTAAPPKASAPPVPANGTLIWTGRLRKNATLVIEGRNATSGTLTGELPGKPVQFRVYPGDLGDNGILVFTASAQDARKGWDSPGPQNGWNRIMYEFAPRTAADLEIQEAPGPGNGWKRLVLRCTNPRLSVILVKWSLF